MFRTDEPAANHHQSAPRKAWSRIMLSKKVAIFWDRDTCPPADNSASDFRLVIHLREMCRQYGSITLFKVYYGPESNNSRPEPGADEGFALDSAGIVAVRRPEMGVSTLATDALCFWADNLGNPCTIVFVTANPTLLYTAAALESRNAEVGFIVPPSTLMDVTPYSSWNREWELAKNNSALGLDKKVPSTPQKTLRSTRAPNDTSTGLVDAVGVNKPTATISQPVKYETTHVPTEEKVVQPLQPVQVMNPLINQKVVFTTVHTLQMLETEPLYISLIKDLKAMEIKMWRRQLKQMFYQGGIAANVRIGFLSVELHRCQECCFIASSTGRTGGPFSKVEKYDGMTRDYLAFSRIGKLMTQVSQVYYQEFDYRRGYVGRAKNLLVEWDRLVAKDKA